MQSIASGNGKNKPPKPPSEKTNLAIYSTATPFFETETVKINPQTMHTGVVKTNSSSNIEEGIPRNVSMTFRGPEKDKPVFMSTVGNLMASIMEGLGENTKKGGPGALLGVAPEERNFIRKNSTTQDLPELITTPTRSKNSSTPNLDNKVTVMGHHVIVENSVKSLKGVGSEKNSKDQLTAKNSSLDLKPPMQNYDRPRSKIIVTAPEEPTQVTVTLVVDVTRENYSQRENLEIEDAQVKELDMTSASNVERNEIQVP